MCSAVSFIGGVVRLEWDHVKRRDRGKRYSRTRTGFLWGKVTSTNDFAYFSKNHMDQGANIFEKLPSSRYRYEDWISQKEGLREETQ